MSRRPAPDPGRPPSGVGGISYNITITLKRGCATAIVVRHGGFMARRVGSVSWRHRDDLNLKVEGHRRGSALILADQRKRGVRPPIVRMPRL